MNFLMNMMVCHVLATMNIVATSTIGTNAYNWFMSIAQPAVFILVAVSGLILFAKKEVSKLVAWFIISVLACVMVINPQGFVNVLTGIGNAVLGI